MTTKSKTDIVKPRFVKVYDLEEYEQLLKGIRVPACMLTESHQVVDEASVMRRLSALTLNGPSDGNACSCCGVGPFETRAQQTAHYKQHWHTHNLKRKLFGKLPLSLGQFNSRQEDDLSVSETDSESEDYSNKPASDLFAAATRHCKAFFTNKSGQVFCVYRCILHHKKEELSTDGDGSAWMERCRRLAVPVFQRWAVLMVSGGRFAGAIFSGSIPVVHKTHRAYVTRRGQGQSQASRDSRSHLPRSAGANLRRYCQAQFLEHVQEVVATWAEDLMGCEFILYRAVGSLNQAALFGKNSPLKREDLRVRVLPFPTKKPSYKEVKRVHETVASVEVYDTMELFQKALISSTAKPPSKSGSDTSVVKKPQKTPPKPIDRAKSRECTPSELPIQKPSSEDEGSIERTPRELPTQMLSSEDEGPCFIDSETPKDWIKKLSEQTSNGVTTNSRKDLLNDISVPSPVQSDSETETAEMKEQVKKQKKKKKREEKQLEMKQQELKKAAPQKIPTDIKKMWKAILSTEVTLETILEGWEGGELEAACNTQDPTDGNTALHKAAIAEKPDMVTQILTAGGDPCIRNHQLQTAYAATPHPETRAAFRLFQGQFPDKYNYAKSHIPGPVTPEMLEVEREKKAQQKRAKRQRDKEKQAEKVRTNQFLLMTDSEKLKIVQPRCFLCGSSLPKKPFEYDNFKFCAIKCMQNHRNLRPLHKSA